MSARISLRALAPLALALSLARPAAAQGPVEERILSLPDQCHDVGRPIGRAGARAGPPPHRRRSMHRCTLHAGGAVRRVALDLDAWGLPAGIDVYPAAGSRPLQRLSLFRYGSEPAQEWTHVVEGVDLNGDGWTDLKVLISGGTGGAFFAVFRYDAARGRFVADTALWGGGGVVPLRDRCVGTGSRSGWGNHSDADYCWRGGRWVRTRTEDQRRLDPSGSPRETRFVRVRRALRGGRMRVVSVDTLRDRDP